MHECVLYTSVCFAIMYSSHTWTAQVQARASPGAAGPCHDGLGDAVLCRSKAVARPAPGRSKAKLLTRTEILLSARHSILLHVCDASEEPRTKFQNHGRSLVKVCGRGPFFGALSAQYPLQLCDDSWAQRAFNMHYCFRST